RFNVDNQVEREKITFWRVLSGIPYLTPEALFRESRSRRAKAGCTPTAFV
ncbi:MAG: hypothetical protein K0Q94_961, partial [Paenibacillus sp.]|nr:hypothetical protein [Paenibacillus sp.]